MSSVNWYSVYTKPRQEDIICKRLLDFEDIEVFNPKIKTKRYLRGRLREVIEELFPCYIFLMFDLDKYYHMIKYTRGVRRIVGDRSGNPYNVDIRIIEYIKSKVKDGYITIEPPEFSPGEKVVIKEGPLEGLVGIFQKNIKASERVMILLNTLEYQAKMEIEKGFLAKA
jgi:transcription elongation factor/antiterminator RfaH